MESPARRKQILSEQAYNLASQTYLRIPGILLDPIPILIPYVHRAALTFLKPSQFKLDRSWEEYYDVLQPFDDVAYKLVDVFEYCINELKYSVPAAEKQLSSEKPDWKAPFERVLDNLGSAAKGVGLRADDVMWIAFLYTRAYANTPKAFRVKDRKYWFKANIRYLHDLLAEWEVLLKEKGFEWPVIFSGLFGG
ncbi:uncharacterized protein CTRU02_213353 [Colletotrichum truncatum]|uniref:Uncharacterized protein n=1 Tax=Colletotrichum truncatum TaxID=5467 RepID=A0ACC3YKH1_COLTU|nr:uncharacterized protein CTRU02_13355 [Colletotrichum truncatum]KAF6783365.1 hypothetical protein CTRU02_13355 [Colletotrichum truncatum]